MVRAVETGTDQLLCQVEEHVATLTFNRPEKRNALGDIVTPALREMLLVLEADADVRVIVLTGAGKAFCAGGDVKGMGGGAPDDRSLDDKIRALQHRQQTLTLRLHEMSKPTIGALPGAAAGAGMSIALACDIRIGAVSAFYAPGFGAIGLSGDYGGSWQLTQLVGPAKAKEIYFTGRRVHAKEALSLGLLNEVVPDEELQARTAELAAGIAGGQHQAIGHRAQIEMADGRGLQTFVVGHDNRHRCIELSKSAHHPVLAPFLVVTRNAHRFKKLDSHFDLTLAVDAFIATPYRNLALHLGPGQHPFGVAPADTFQRFAGNDMEKPGLRIHRRRRALGDFDNFLDDLFRHRVGFVATDTSSFANQGLEIHTNNLTKNLRRQNPPACLNGQARTAFTNGSMRSGAI